MKIYLLNARFPLSLWDFSGCSDIDGSAFPFPPLSLATLAALTPKGHEVVICDENVHSVAVSDDADVIGITGYTIQKESVFILADAFRKRGITVAIGGPLVQESTLEECAIHADAVFLGEAEYTWPMFVRDAESKNIQPLYIQKELVDMSNSPVPRFDLLELSAYSSAIIETSRGCPHSCEFCEIPIRLGKGSRVKTTEQVMAEISALYLLGADSIFIIDDNFLGNRTRAIELLSQIREFVRSIDYRVYFSCQFTIDIARDENILSLLKEANFRRVFVGIETPRESSLVGVKKRQNTRINLLEAVCVLQAHSIIVWGAFIVGFDDDDVHVFDEQFDFIQSASIPVAMVGILQALPGTPLYRRVVAEGRLINNEAGGIRSSCKHLSSTNIMPKHMTITELISGYRSLVKRLYSCKNFAERLINAVKAGEKNVLRSGPKLTKKDVLILLRILRYYLFTTEPWRAGMFVRVITQTLIHNPAYLKTALMHLVVYKHLKMFYEKA